MFFSIALHRRGPTGPGRALQGARLLLFGSLLHMRVPAPRGWLPSVAMAPLLSDELLRLTHRAHEQIKATYGMGGGRRRAADEAAECAARKRGTRNSAQAQGTG